MKSRKYLKKIIAMVLIAAVLLTTTGCDGSEIMNYMMDKLGTTVTPGARLLGSGWINSDLIGAIDENTEIDLKDDFHTAVNRDWLLETEVGEEGSVSFLGSMETIMEEQLLEIFIPGKEYVPDEKIMSQQAYAHMEQLILDLMELAGNEEKRNALGAEPLRPYLEAIEGIDSLEEMTAYLCNESENNFLQETLLNCFIDVPISSRGYYTVHISPCENLLLRSSESYSTLPGWEYYELREKEESLRKVLVKLGY
ncbi:MAG: hypothetical protein Q4B50_04815, partial [Bacillota bacterium]|nr:hypothetical protein [Bacillota bacterium]